ncbi:MAG TPA: hypothetical protein VM848_10100 [Acidimicrobiia bacterium]|jgi:hypothetical protein|nr:hypothetical protein [Acidimicrobiia bacterium]
MVDLNIDLDGDQDRLESIELVRGWVAAYLIAERDRMTSDGLATYINANASILTDRPDVETVKLLLHGIDYAAQIIRYLLGLCAFESAGRHGEDQQDVDRFVRIREAVWEGTKDLDT